MKLSVVYMVENEEFWLPISLKSIMGWADEIVIIDGGSTDRTIEKIHELFGEDERLKIFSHPYHHEFDGADGHQRNQYLTHITGDWCLVLDADEVVSDNGVHLKDILATVQQNIDCFDVKMEHFIWHLNLIDATVPQHFVQRRLFRIKPDLSYPEVEHSLLQGVDNIRQLSDITIFHYGYVQGIQKTIKKFHNNIIKSNIHDQQFLQQWKNGHILGTFPVSPFIGIHPRPIREVFGI